MVIVGFGLDDGGTNVLGFGILGLAIFAVCLPAWLGIIFGESRLQGSTPLVAVLWGSLVGLSVLSLLITLATFVILNTVGVP